MGLLIGLMAAILWCCHPSPSGVWLRRWMVERPAAALSRMRAAHVVFFAVAVAAVLLAFHIFEIEGVRVVGAAVLEAAPGVLALDVGAVIELYAVLWVLGATRRAKAGVQVVRTLGSQTVRGAWRVCRGWRRSVVGRSRPRVPKGRNADPDGGGWLAYA